MRSDCIIGTRVPSGEMKMFWDQIEVMATHMVNVLNATELYTLKWFILGYVNFTSIFKNRRH